MTTKEGQSRKRKRARRHREPPQSTHTTEHKRETHQREHARQSSASAMPPKSSSSSSSSSSFLDKIKAKLAGGHFRMINEKLYTCTGEEALKYFKEDPALFDMYHTGYQEQMSHWPEQPTPLDSASVDVAVFSLSLMGTNFSNYLKEAHRVLKPSGWLLIAEVKSRFDPSNGGADPNKFSTSVCDLGFTSMSKDLSNKMFILLYFKKKENQKSKKKEIEWPELKPCLYKRR
ncbi:hypothetical protein SLEP1_g45251 [Rubroshorea leprosula]|uniref:Ribosomal RNA-processing protein 8 n=1 Tax=Rubroshorea leprosula TaxID=152421 RepID=A0AAV5LJZ5_9ROSI|nr:hypothetical protein SLEP1_g45251 [Rubroshorea leprosula]